MEKHEQVETLAVERIATEGTQVRAMLSETIITEYAEALVRGDEFPPVEVYFDDRTYWLADGFHRLSAARLARRNTIPAVVHPGGRREALLHAVSANETHGLRRTDADRRHAVLLLLDDPEWRLWSNNEIARQCQVSESFVRTLRREKAPKTPAGSPAPTRKVQRGGKTYMMQTGRIGTKGKTRTERTEAEKDQRAAAVAPTPEAPVQRGQVIPLTAMASKQVPERSVPEQPEPIVQPATPALPEVTTSTVQVEAPKEPEQPLSSFETKIERTPRTDIEGPASRPSSLAEAWDVATPEERQAFVAVYSDELRALLGMLGHQEPEQGAAAPSETPQVSVRKTARRKGKK